MKLNKMYAKGIVTGISCSLAIGLATMSFANGSFRNLNAFYNDIKLVIDGKSVQPTDANGRKVEPFIVDGTTYLPIRAVGEALGKNVDWDGSTQTVHLGAKPGEINYMTEIIKPYRTDSVDIYDLNDPKPLEMGGVDFASGFEMTAQNSYMMFNLNSQYQEISGILGGTRWRNLISSDFNIYLDGKLYKTIEVDPNNLPEEITIPVSGVNQLKLEQRKTWNATNIGFADPKIK